MAQRVPSGDQTAVGIWPKMVVSRRRRVPSSLSRERSPLVCGSAWKAIQRDAAADDRSSARVPAANAVAAIAAAARAPAASAADEVTAAVTNERRPILFNVVRLQEAERQQRLRATALVLPGRSR